MGNGSRHSVSETIKFKQIYTSRRGKGVHLDGCWWWIAENGGERNEDELLICSLCRGDRLSPSHWHAEAVRRKSVAFLFAKSLTDILFAREGSDETNLINKFEQLCTDCTNLWTDTWLRITITSSTTTEEKSVYHTNEKQDRKEWALVEQNETVKNGKETKELHIDMSSFSHMSTKPSEYHYQLNMKKQKEPKRSNRSDKWNRSRRNRNDRTNSKNYPNLKD